MLLALHRIYGANENHSTETALDIIASLDSTTATAGPQALEPAGFSVPTCPHQCVTSSRLAINLTLLLLQIWRNKTHCGLTGNGGK